MLYLPLLFFIAFSVPSSAISVGSINLRLDDLIIYFFFVANIRECIYHFNKLINSFDYAIFSVLFVYATLSLFFVALIHPEKISNYYLFKFLGSLPHLFVLPVWLMSERYRRMLHIGVVFSAVVFSLQVFFYLNQINLADMKTSASIKSAASFGSLNPNAVGTYALIIFIYLVILNFSNTKLESWMKKISFFSLILISLVPFAVFTRANIGAMLFIMLMSFVFTFNRKQKIYSSLVFINIGIIFSVAYWDYLEGYILGAFDIDFSTGEGTSSRTFLWKQALELVDIYPIFGHGMTSEIYTYKKYFQGQMSHSIVFRYWIELGAVGLCLFLFSYAQFFTSKIYKFLRTGSNLYLQQAICMTGFFVADIFGQIQYFDKLHYMILFITTINLKSRNTRLCH
ncbi:O-antigen ligase family protein [Vibrio sp. Isolate33]|uniref:O-antigen ligase family protein n=1 Tax=Vibrio sp. Isolate33 TaxID=2908539 RepID=UPI001EFD9D83|nr:O-antigen ligase family protein [Vibrio sp. Isolate33]MCG9544449.1 O-antigen ligase family protein [Vibrio sp. Isolate33]